MAAPISDAERGRRRQIVDEAHASSALEGGQSTAEARQLQGRWMEGQLTFEEMQAQTLALYKFPVSS